MYRSLWGGSPWFNVHEDRQGAYYSCYCCSLLSQLSSRLIFSLGKSIILVIGESPITVFLFVLISSMVLLAVGTRLSLLFHCSLRALELMYQHNLQSWRVLFFLFLTHIVCLCLFLVLTPWASLSNFLSIVHLS